MKPRSIRRSGSLTKLRTVPKRNVVAMDSRVPSHLTCDQVRFVPAQHFQNRRLREGLRSKARQPHYRVRHFTEGKHRHRAERGQPKLSPFCVRIRYQILERLNVCGLPALGSLDHVELYGLSFLKALEATGDDRRVVSEYVLAILTADKAKPLSIVEPLHCSITHPLYVQITVEIKSRVPNLLSQGQQFSASVWKE